MDFNAASVSVEEDEDLWRVAFADSRFNARRYLVFQRGKAPDAQDVELGLDGYSVEVNTPENACYGGVELFELAHDHAAVTFEEDALPGLDGVATVIVRFSLRGKQRDQLRGCLARIFDGYGCFLDAGG